MAEPERSPSASTMLTRGIRGRCPLCGGGHLRRNWFGLVERCPTCGHKYSRGGDQALALGGYMIQIIFVFGGLLVLMFLYIAKSDGASGFKDIPFSLFIVAAGIIIFVGTLLLYPFTKMLWVATDLVMQSPSPLEQANAVLYKAQGEEAANRAFDQAMGVEAARKRQARRRRGSEGAAANEADELLAIDIAAGRVTGAEAEDAAGNVGAEERARDRAEADTDRGEPGRR